MHSETVWLPYETQYKRDELVQKFVTRSRVGIFRNERTRSTPLDPKLPSFACLTKLGAKRAELVQKFMPRTRIRIFRKERTRSTPLEPNSCSGAFCSVSVHLAMFCYYTELGAKLVHFVVFGCILDCFVTA